MGLAEKIAARMIEIEAEHMDRLPEAAGVFKATLGDVLGVQGSRDDRSVPGEAPRRQTGHLQGSIAPPIIDEAGGRAFIGPGADYGKYLRPSRPFYLLAIGRCRDHLRAILLGR